MIDEEDERLILRSTSLLSKWGFWDGDQFADFVHENYNMRWTTQERSGPHEVTYRLVMKYLIPALPVPVRVITFSTHHNGTRVHEDDYEELKTQPETIVKITKEQLMEVCAEVEKDYKQ